jgi:hypothetical protein
MSINLDPDSGLPVNLRLGVLLNYIILPNTGQAAGFLSALSMLADQYGFIYLADTLEKASIKVRDPATWQAGSSHVTNVQVSVSGGKATVTWTTDVAADSHVDYGLDTTYGLYEDNFNPTTAHSLRFNIDAGLTYYYQVRSEAMGILAFGPRLSFTT